MKRFFLTVIAVACCMSSISASDLVDGRWSEERVNSWYAELPWLVGCNYIPATAINQIDMWQASTFDPKQIDKELGWAESIGMNTLRVYLHDMVWADDEKGLYKRMDKFLDICEKHGIRPWFVFFDDCHFPNPQLGVQPLPVRDYHNSGWVNSPSRELAIRYADGKASEQEVANLKGYVQKTMARFSNDKRVLMWELYNEPGRGTGENGNMDNNPSAMKLIGDKSAKLVYDSWVWAREANPKQPIISNTSGSVGKRNIAINEANTDIYSLHWYRGAAELRKLIEEHQAKGRPVMITEWLARNGSNVKECLPVMKELKAGAVNWGFVLGESGTAWSWRSRIVDGVPRNVAQERKDGNVIKEGEKMSEPKVWFHDLFRTDGTPYSEAEIKIFRELTKDNLYGI